MSRDRRRIPEGHQMPQPAMTTDSKEALRRRFLKNGCFRTPNPKRRKNEKGAYKKGFEIRLVATDEDDLAHLRRLLIDAGFKPGKSYPKHAQMIQPVYGADAVARFR